MSTKGIINKIIKFSSVDGPGNRTAIFLQSCNYNCAYCHNPETINYCINCGDCAEVCPTKSLELLKINNNKNKIYWNYQTCIDCDECIKICKYNSSPKTKIMTAEEVFQEIGTAISFIRGITVSGGECTLQRDFIIELFKLAKKQNLTTYIDTNGSHDFSKDEQLLQVTDYVMLDIKVWDNIQHEKLTDDNNLIVLKNLEFLAKQNKLFEIRTVVLGETSENTIFDFEETIIKASKIIKDYPNIKYKIIKYRNIGVREKYNIYKMPSKIYLEKLKILAQDNGVLEENIIIV